MSTDPRLAAFLSERIEIFQTIQHRHEIWRPDPFDVETVHVEARDEFERMLTRATMSPGTPYGSILLLLGDSGCGKTHLIRAFRNLVHEKELGFVGYMQMTTATSNYGRYTLSNLIESLDQPYSEQRQPLPGLMRLSNALHSRCGKVAEVLREPEQLEEEEVHQMVEGFADELIRQPAFAAIDVDLLRALLYLQRDDARIKSRVLKYLRCEDLSGSDRKVLGGLVPRINDDDPQRMVEHLGRVMNAVGHALVLCVDQLEDMYSQEDAKAPFQRAMQTLCTLADRVPSSVIVICCLEDFWDRMRMDLGQSKLDRIEQNPERIVLRAPRTPEEARKIAARRLAYLYEQEGVGSTNEDETYPFPSESFEALSNFRTRSVLDECRRYRERAARDGKLPARFPLPASGEAEDTATPPEPQPWLELDQAWNDFRTGHRSKAPEEEAGLAELLAWALKAGADELSTGHVLDASAVGEAVKVDLTPGERLYVAVCNSNPRGGGLGKQLERARGAAKDRVPVIVRSTVYPDSPKSQTATLMGRLISAGGRRTVLEDSEARTLVALRDFRQKHEARPDLREWLRETKPVTRLKAVRDILDLEHLAPVAAPAPVAPPPVAAPRPAARAPEPVAPKAEAPSAAAPTPEEMLRVGQVEGLFPEPSLLSLDELTRHAAFLGGSGSGKTTLALNLVEQLLLRGIPAILVDRKGDLAGYASEEAWKKPLADAARTERRARLHERIDVALFTPGHPNGRPLAIPLVPPGLDELSPFEREQSVGHSAQALGGMLDYKHTGKDKQCRTVLERALNLLVQARPQGELSLEHLLQFIESQDPLLMNAVGRLDTKLLGKLVQDLETLRLNAKALLAAEGERLDMDLLLGRGKHARAGRTRLSVISTKFLGDNTRILFWVSQLLIETSRWMSRNPSGGKLQAVVLLDEADMYLPAVGLPATKQPIENLLKRARSAGLGLMLATQSPGDFDYKCRDTIRTWFVGRVKENVALQKMKPMLSEAKVDATGKIAAQGTGEFHVLRDGKVSRMKADQSSVATEQLSEDELLKLAKGTASR